jgi:hypothetical protein
VRGSTWGVLVLVLVLSLGIILVAVAQTQSGVAATYRAAVECSDSTSANCYQLSQGVIRSVKVDQTSSGEEDRVVIDTRGTTIDTTLTPSPSQSTKVKLGADVTVKWYVGNVVAVVIGHNSIPSAESPLASAAGMGYTGSLLIWAAAAMAVAWVVGPRLVTAQANVRRSLDDETGISLGAFDGVVPGGTVGWRIKPKMREALLLPIVIGMVALISITPFLNPQRRSIALIGDGVLVVAICIRWALTARNTRVLADRSSIMKADWLGRVKRWPVSDVAEGYMFSVRTLYSLNACIVFVGHDGSELFIVSSFYWDLNEITSVCMTIGISLDGSYDQILIRGSRRKRIAIALGTLVLGALAAAYFFPVPASQ